MNTIKTHIVRCVIAGIVAFLPIGGTLVLLVMFETELRALIRGLPFYFPGMALLLVLIGFYLIGLIVSSLFGGFFVRLFDRILSRVPILGAFYDTLKQIAGYGSGKQAIFERAVLLTNESTGASEFALVTGEYKPTAADDTQILLFLPGSPNPASGRLLLAPRSRIRPIDLPVDAVLKALLSAGKTL